MNKYQERAYRSMFDILETRLIPLVWGNLLCNVHLSHHDKLMSQFIYSVTKAICWPQDHWLRFVAFTYAKKHFYYRSCTVEHSRHFEDFVFVYLFLNLETLSTNWQHALYILNYYWSYLVKSIFKTAPNLSVIHRYIMSTFSLQRNC